MNHLSMNHLSKFKKIKEKAGSHSPSVETIREFFPELSIKSDACFLSNPYATSLFYSWMQSEIQRDTSRFMQMLEFYPSQNRVLAGYMSDILKVDQANIFLCNGAIDGIERILRGLDGSISVPLPTFSSYYEFAHGSLSPKFFYLHKNSDYRLDLEEYQKFIHDNYIDNILLINPSNPTGQGFLFKDIEHFISANKNCKSIIIDESFIHFMELESPDKNSVAQLVSRYENLYVVKSMSKDYGIAGIRLGYIIANRQWIDDTLRYGALWNVSGIGEYFIRLLRDASFQLKYEEARVRFIEVHKKFGEMLQGVEGIVVIPSVANFFLVEILGDHSLEDIVSELLFSYGVYVRDCTDKIGLKGNYIRVATRTAEENESLVLKLKLCINKLKSVD